MKLIIRTAVVLLLTTTATFSQEMNRDQNINKIFELRSQISAIEVEIMKPDPGDIEAAAAQGGIALRLLPREKYDGVLATGGGGSYYSFVRKTHEYGQGTDIGLEQGQLKVGFAGADYGFIADLGSVPLSAITVDYPEIDFLISYKPPTKMSEIRSEQAKSYNYDTPGATFSSRVKSAVGHSYVLRSISFDRSDILVAFKVIRKDSDGSLILFWKELKKFDKPTIDRNSEKN